MDLAQSVIAKTVHREVRDDTPVLIRGLFKAACVVEPPADVVVIERRQWIDLYAATCEVETFVESALGKQNDRIPDERVGIARIELHRAPKVMFRLRPFVRAGVERKSQTGVALGKAVVDL